MTYTTLHRNRLIEQYDPTKNHVWTQVFRKDELRYSEGWTQVFRKDELRYSGRLNSGIPEGWTQIFRKDKRRYSGRINSDIPEGWTQVFRKDELMYSGRISYSCSNSGTHRVAFVARPVISHDWGLWLRQTEHIHGKLWHRYAAMVNQFIVATVQLSMYRIVNSYPQVSQISRSCTSHHVRT